MTESRFQSARRVAWCVALLCGTAAALAPTAASAQRRVYVAQHRYDIPLNLRPVEPATEVGGELAHPFFNGNFAMVMRPYFGFRLRSPWEIYFTIPVTVTDQYNGAAALGNIEVQALTRFQFGPYFRLALGFGGYAPTHSGFDGNNEGYTLRYYGLWSTGGYMPGYYIPGHAIAHFHIGGAWNPGGGMFTLSFEVGNELRIRVSSNRNFYLRAVDLSLFAGTYFAFRVHRVVSVGFGLRFYDWISEGSFFTVPERSAWAGAWSLIAGVRFHAGVFEPGVGVIYQTPTPFREDRPFEGATIYADLRARWY